MSAWSRAARLTAVEFDVCWEWLGLGGTPPVLELPSPGRDADERRRVIAAATHDLRLRGLAGSGGPGQPLARALRVLAHPGYELDLRHRGPAGTTVGLAAVAGSHGVLAARRGEELAILAVDASRVLPALVELAGPIVAGTGRPVTLAAEVLDAARATRPATASGLADELVRRGVSWTDASSVARMCCGAQAFGQLGVTARNRGAPWVVGFHQTPFGHFGQLRRPGRPGRGAEVTLGPLNATRLGGHARDLLRSVHDPDRSRAA